MDFVTLDQCHVDRSARSARGGHTKRAGCAAALGWPARRSRRRAWSALREEAALYAYASKRMLAVSEVETYTAWDVDQRRVGIIPFNLEVLTPRLAREVLSAEHEVGVRHGLLLRPPMVMHLLRVDAATADRVLGGGRCVPNKPSRHS